MYMLARSGPDTDERSVRLNFCVLTSSRCPDGIESAKMVSSAVFQTPW